MSSPSVLLAIWNDVAVERISEYEAWHTLEHVPERVWVPGFVAASRYIGRQGSEPRYLTLYDVGSPDVLATPAYTDLVERPTDWTASMRPAFRNFQRQPCLLKAAAGRSAGGWILATRFVLPQRIEGERLESFARAVLTDGARLCVTSVRIGEEVQAGPQAIANAAPPATGISYLAILECAAEREAEGLSTLFTSVANAASNLLANVSDRKDGIYQFSSRVTHTDVRAPVRPEQRLDLMNQWR